MSNQPNGGRVPHSIRNLRRRTRGSVSGGVLGRLLVLHGRDLLARDREGGPAWSLFDRRDNCPCWSTSRLPCGHSRTPSYAAYDYRRAPVDLTTGGAR